MGGLENAPGPFDVDLEVLVPRVVTGRESPEVHDGAYPATRVAHGARVEKRCADQFGRLTGFEWRLGGDVEQAKHSAIAT